MARFIKHPKTGELVRIEISAPEMSEKILGVELDELLSWRELIPPDAVRGAETIYTVRSKKELETLKKRAAVLKTGMNERAVKNVEEAGMLDAYAKLSEDCPEGATAHVWRSYGLVVLMQTKFNVKVDAAELAKRANLTKRNDKGKAVPDEEQAGRHLRLLQGLGYLTDADDRWEHKGLPVAWVGQEES